MAKKLTVPKLDTEQRNPSLHSPYLPPGPAPNVFEEFAGVNTSTSRPGVDDKQAFWLDGFMPIGRRFARTLYGVGDPIVFSDSAVISFFGFINIGSTPYCIVIHIDGSVHAVNTDTYASSEIAPAGTITSPSRLNVGICQYGNEYLIIVSSQTNGYFIWDGTTFYEPGDSFSGGTVPTGISGTAVETYAGRVWIANGPGITFSAPGSLRDFTTGSGGGNFESSDSFLRVRFTQLVQTNGFLYLVADSSVNYISGVQTSGTPPTTTFTNQNADPEIGSPWPSTVGTFGRNILFANAFGAHVSYGAAVTKISEALDGVWNTVPNFAGLVPSAAKSIVFGKRCWSVLLPIIDPISGQQVNKLLMWNGKVWWASEQDVSLIYIANQEIDSVLTTWGTDGSSIYPLFDTPSTAFLKTAQSRLWDTPVGYEMVKTVNRVWAMGYVFDVDDETVDISLDNEISSDNFESFEFNPPAIVWFNDDEMEILWENNASETIEWFSSGLNGVAVTEPAAIAQKGVLLGITVKTMKSDMALISVKFPAVPEDYRG